MNKKGIIFLGTFLVSICMWLTLRVMVQYYVHMPERSLWLSKAQMIRDYRHVPGDVVIVGSSRAMSINPLQLRREYGVNAVNLSVGGATTPSTYFFLKRLIKNNPGLKEVYLEFAPINMTRKDTDLDASLGENFIRYVATAEEAEELNQDLPGALAKFNQIRRFPYSKFINTKDLSLLEAVIVRWRTGKTDENLIKEIVGNRGYFLYPQKFSFPSQTPAFERQAEEGCRKLGEYASRLPSVTAVYFRKIISLCREHNVNCVIFFSPANQASLRFENLAYGETYRLFATQRQFVNDEIPVLENKLFAEPSHVNANGSAVFTKFFYDSVLNHRHSELQRIMLFSQNHTDQAGLNAKD